MKKLFILIVSILFLFSCGDNKSKNELLDLMKYGLPIEIQAPAESVVKANDLGFYKDVTVKGGEDYFIQILSTSATSSNTTQLKQEQLREVKKNPYFNKIIFDESNGFIFEKKIDSIFNYDFRYVKIQGNLEYIFQTGLYGNFSEESVKKMYESVK